MSTISNDWLESLLYNTYSVYNFDLGDTSSTTMTANQAYLQSSQTSYTSHVDAIDSVLGLMEDLKSSASNLTNLSSFVYSTATSSDTNVASLKTSVDAPTGNYSVEVQKLATSSIIATQNSFQQQDGQHQSLTSDDGEPVTFTYSLGEDGEEVTIELEEGSTVEDLVNAINNDPNNTGVRASLIASGNGYIFQMQSTSTGAENQINYSTNISEEQTGGWNELKAQDAEFVVNGFSDQVLTSSSNTVSGVIEGVTMDLKSVGTTYISVTEDTGAIKEAVEEWVDLVNQLKVATSELSYNSSMSGDYIVSAFASRLNSLITSQASGFGSTLGEDGQQATYSLLSELGITTDADENSATFGQLIIDEDKLNAAIESNPYEVANFFTGTGASTSTNDFSLSSVTSNVSTGTYEVNYTVTNGVIESVTIGGFEATLSEDGSNRYTVTNSNSLAYGMSIEFGSNLQDGSYNESISLQEGKAVEFSNFLNDETYYSSFANENNSALGIKRANYNDLANYFSYELAASGYVASSSSSSTNSWLSDYSSFDDLLAAYYDAMQTNSSIIQSA